MNQPLRRRRADVLEPEKVAEILRRYAAGEPVYKIARQTGVSRGTIYQIVRGTHVSQQPGADTYTRCSGCRALVLQPCLACAIQNQALPAKTENPPAAPQ